MSHLVFCSNPNYQVSASSYGLATKDHSPEVIVPALLHHAIWTDGRPLCPMMSDQSLCVVLVLSQNSFSCRLSVKSQISSCKCSVSSLCTKVPLYMSSELNLFTLTYLTIIIIFILSMMICMRY